jgi:hypothetical protein
LPIAEHLAWDCKVACSLKALKLSFDIPSRKAFPWPQMYNDGEGYNSTDFISRSSGQLNNDVAKVHEYEQQW